MPLRSAIRPSLLSRSAGSSFSAALRSSSSARAFSASSMCCAEDDKSTPSSISTTLPPESPRYVRIATPPQAEDVRKPPRRGHMPVPRDIFKIRRMPGRKRDDPSIVPKTDPVAFTANVAPRSKAEERGDAPRSKQEAMRRRLAESRRQSLESGLTALWTRQKERARKEQARSTNLASRNRRAALKPEDRDDVLTRPSVRESTITTAVIRDPHRHERQAEAAARTAAIAQVKREGRRDALMELYQAAGKFIVDEEELEQRVNELFRPDYFKEEGYSYGTVNAQNVWDVVGKPATVQDMMSGITRTETKLYDAKRSEMDRTTKRQKLVAEALTGGKMPV